MSYLVGLGGEGVKDILEACRLFLLQTESHTPVLIRTDSRYCTPDLENITQAALVEGLKIDAT